MKVNKQEIHTQGGANIQGDVHTGGDLIGRDKHIHGDEVHGDKRESYIFNGNITLVSSEQQIAALLAAADARGAEQLLSLLLKENQRDQQDNRFVREAMDETVFSRLLKVVGNRSEPKFKTHLPFLDNGALFMNRFKIKGFIGRGGFSDAYIAWDMVHDQETIIKRLKFVGEQEDYLNRFVNRERTIATRLRKQRIKGIVHTYDVLNGDGEVCLVQEHIPGDSLHERLRLRGTLDVVEAIDTTVAVSKALDELHHGGVVHCDIKPLNIIITAPGKPVVVDLGAARFIGEQIPADEIVVSPFYSAPELYTARSVDGRVDIYSLAITLLHMLTGLPDIENVVIGENVVIDSKGESQRIFETMPLPNRYNNLPPQEILQQYTDKSLEQVWPPQLQSSIRAALVDGAERFRTVGEFAAALSEI